jgi:hypothetical protein
MPKALALTIVAACLIAAWIILRSKPPRWLSQAISAILAMWFAWQAACYFVDAWQNGKLTVITKACRSCEHIYTPIYYAQDPVRFAAYMTLYLVTFIVACGVLGFLGWRWLRNGHAN